MYDTTNAQLQKMRANSRKPQCMREVSPCLILLKPHNIHDIYPLSHPPVIGYMELGPQNEMVVLRRHSITLTTKNMLNRHVSVVV